MPEQHRQESLQMGKNFAWIVCNAAALFSMLSGRCYKCDAHMRDYAPQDTPRRVLFNDTVVSYTENPLTSSILFNKTF